MKEWFTSAELATLESMPNTPSNVTRKAHKENWIKRQRTGLKGVAFEYHISSFPPETKLKLVMNDMEQTGAASEDVSQKTLEPNLMDDFALIPGYRIQVSAGHGALNPDQLEPSRYLAFRRKWLKFRGFNESDLAIVWAKGDSMEPTIHSNDTLVVHLGRNIPADGHIYIFRNGEELFVKRYQSLLGAWRLISDNSFYRDQDVPKQEQHQFEVVGQVVHIAKDIGD